MHRDVDRGLDRRVAREDLVHLVGHLARPLEREPECTTTITFWATVEDPLAIVKGSFRGRSIAAYSRKSIRIGTDTHAQRYQSTVRLSVSRPFDSGAALLVTTSSSDRNGRTR